jgi:hypothetical protein
MTGDISKRDVIWRRYGSPDGAIVVSPIAAIVPSPIRIHGARNSWSSLVIMRITYQDSSSNIILVLTILTRKRTQGTHIALRLLAVNLNISPSTRTLLSLYIQSHSEVRVIRASL